MPASIFAGSKVKTLKDTLTLNDKSDIISSTTDPTAVAVNAPIGSLLINQTNGKLYRKLDSGSSTNWEEVGSGVGGINYILNPSAEVNTAGWSTYADAAGAAPVDGTGGSPAVTWTRSTTSPLRGVADFNFVKDAVNRQGQGVSYDFTIDDADKAKVLTVSFDYEVLSGTYADGDLTVYLIADPTGTPVVIQPAGYTVLAATVGTTMREIATFQTQATGTSYRLCFHVASTSASAYTLAVDNVVVGPQTQLYGAPVTDWVGVPAANYGTLYGLVSLARSEFVRRVGDSIEWMGYIQTTTTGATLGVIQVGLPTFYQMDDSKLQAAQIIGSAHLFDSASVADVGIAYPDLGNNRLSFHSLGALWNSSTSIPISWDTSDFLRWNVKVPISGWSSSVQMSNDTDTRVVAATIRGLAQGGATTNEGFQLNTSAATVPFLTVAQDTHGAVSSGVFTAPVSGYYKVTTTCQFFLTTTGTPSGLNELARISIAVDGAAVADNPIYGSGVNTTLRQNESFSYTVFVNSGQTISIRGSRNGTYTSAGWLTTFSTTNFLAVERLSGPATIAASEAVACAYNTSTSTITGSGVWSLVTYTNKVIDTHGIYNTSTGIATIPVSGIYRITHRMRGKNPLTTAGRYLSLHFSVNGTAFANNPVYTIVWGNTEQTTFTDANPPAIYTAQFNAGDLIRFSMDSNSTTPSNNGPEASATASGFSIERIS
jgi:hypothetical protein